MWHSDPGACWGNLFFFCFLPCEGLCGPWYNVPIPSKPLNQLHPKGSQKRLKLLSMTWACRWEKHKYLGRSRKTRYLTQSATKCVLLMVFIMRLMVFDVYNRHFHAFPNPFRLLLDTCFLTKHMPVCWCLKYSEYSEYSEYNMNTACDAESKMITKLAQKACSCITVPLLQHSATTFRSIQLSVHVFNSP